MTREELKKNILDTVSDCMSDLLYYDRKEDEDLPRGAIEQAITDGVVTEQEILDIVIKALQGK